MMSFDEYHAAQQRERMAVGDKSSPSSQTNTSPKKMTENSIEKTIEKEKYDGYSYGRKYLGEFIELYQLQLLCIVLIVLDGYTALLEVFLVQEEKTVKSIIRDGSSAFVVPFLSEHLYGLILASIRSLRQFSLTYFICEMMVVYYSFGFLAVWHLGYSTDTIVLMALLATDIYTSIGLVNRILNIFRIWRIVRICSSMISAERENTERVIRLHDEAKREKTRMELEITTLNEQIATDREAKAGMENMLQAYKDEIDTLNEALKIAAMDIAQAGESDVDSVEEEDMSISEDMTADSDHHVTADESSVKGSNQPTISITRKSQTSRQEGRRYGQPVMDSSASVLSSLSNSSRPSRQSDQSARRTQSNPTFIVNEDGSYRIIS